MLNYQRVTGPSWVTPEIHDSRIRQNQDLDDLDVFPRSSLDSLHKIVGM